MIFRGSSAVEQRAVNSPVAGSIPAPEAKRVAALFVETGGCYFGLDGVDPWDRERDARNYPGDAPVVAHPPCARWCQLAPVNQARYGIPIGADEGCFEAALASVRRFGGVLEHPAYSIAWRRYRLPPPLAEGWLPFPGDEWVGHVEQGHYGHAARKATWILVKGPRPPELIWGPARQCRAWISTDRPRADLPGTRQLQKKEASASPPAFRDVLISLARAYYI